MIFSVHGLWIKWKHTNYVFVYCKCCHIAISSSQPPLPTEGKEFRRDIQKIEKEVKRKRIKKETRYVHGGNDDVLFYSHNLCES